MNDTYVEQLVARKTDKMALVAKVVIYALIVGCAVLGFAMKLFSLYFVAVLLFAAAYFLLPMFDIEFEYLYLSKEISIDKVIAKQRRKHVMTIDLNKVEIIAPASSHELDSFNARPHDNKDFSSNEDNAKSFVLAYMDGEKLMLIKMDLNEDILKAIKMVFPRKIKEY